MHVISECYLPCNWTPPLQTQGYPPAKNDFLFERRLNEHVHGVVAENSKGRPALVFCRCATCASACMPAHVQGRMRVQRAQEQSAALLIPLDKALTHCPVCLCLLLPHSSRNSTSETAQAIAKEAQLHRGGKPGGAGPFVRGAAQQQRLQQAVAATKNKALQVTT